MILNLYYESKLNYLLLKKLIFKILITTIIKMVKNLT